MATVSQSDIAASLLGALQGTASVLLTLFSGYFCAKIGILDKNSTRRVNGLCSKLFLPCLLITQIGSDLTLAKLRKSWIIPVWGLASTLVAHAIGWAGKMAFKLRAWIIVASGRPNSSALPLMLLDSLSKAGVLDTLQGGTSRSKTLDRAKSLILLNVVVQQCVMFVAGPGILSDDAAKQKKRKSHLPTIQDRKNVGLLDADSDDEDEQRSLLAPLDALENVPDLPHWHLPPSLDWLRKLGIFVNPPIVGALIALCISFVPPLRHTIFEGSGALNVALGEPLKNPGGLYIALQLFIVGSELAISGAAAKPDVGPTSFALAVRFAIMPALALGGVWIIASQGFYTDDPLTLFLLVIIPSGPSAMVQAPRKSYYMSFPSAGHGRPFWTHLVCAAPDMDGSASCMLGAAVRTCSAGARGRFPMSGQPARPAGDRDLLSYHRCRSQSFASRYKRTMYGRVCAPR
ncbi:hypothetical protein AURDEDRAFT_68207 [Auricularia subglabra TFB-10046 SS5]|nr:hypothetical protein AURDEDRAFT_68207 [Auricularia subglabra TFB-10046 SS5]